MRSLRVLVADDQPLMRRALRLFLDHEDDLECVGEAADGREAVELCERLRPDAVLMDLQMPVMDGPEAIRVLAERHPEIVVIAVTTFSSERYVLPALRAGARGYLLKSAEPEEFISAVRAACRGTAVLSPSVAAALVEAEPPAPEPDPALQASLTPREREVLELMGRGASNAEIAAALQLGEPTVKTHVGNLFAKLGARDRTQAVVLAARAGLIRVGPAD
ncbi:DNA-binding response regulator [Kocuria dechangensis]|uniref:DNA-binding response regulator n=1 Tax=Kocuria dechangensis TaxID=1176249 RepID=A0A917LNZ8_9MICC|nr:response regulator transcription factor [Kocuria dechangensis]GGG47052.1 DNA-binding response regulator [Kocuria dechangensis]